MSPIEIERSWIKQKPGGVLKIKPEEWKQARMLAGELIKPPKNQTPPFKISREELQARFPELADSFNHSMLVLPSDEPPGYKIGAMARAKVFSDETTGKEVREGILGRGAFGVVKVVQWQDGTADAVKIEGSDPTEQAEHAIEMQIMRALGYLKEEFVRIRGDKSQWIGEGEIGDKQYTVQERIAGVEMKDYFASAGIFSMDADKRYLFALRAALAIKKLHDMGIIHGDIKPANFMINVNGKIVVVEAIDFGLSLRLKEGRTEIESMHPKGTPKYVAPEICGIEKKGGDVFLVRPPGGISRYSKASDVYALGKMFTLDLGLILPKFPDVIRDLLDDMTEEDPARRPTMEKVIRVFSNPENYEKFERMHEYIDSYIAEQGVRKKSLWARLKVGAISSESQIEMVKKLEDILGRYRKDTSDETVKELLALMQENQERHENARFTTAGFSNLKILQGLPEEIRGAPRKRHCASSCKCCRESADPAYFVTNLERITVM